MKYNNEKLFDIYKTIHLRITNKFFVRVSFFQCNHRFFLQKKEKKKKNKQSTLEHETQTPSFLVFSVVNPKTTARFSWWDPSGSQRAMTAILPSPKSFYAPHDDHFFRPPSGNDAQFLCCPSLQSAVLHFTRSVSRCREENRSTGHRLALKTETINLTHDTEPRGVNLPLTYYPCLIGVRLKEPPLFLSRLNFSRFKI